MPVPGEVAAELCEWFGPTALAKNVQKLLEDGVRVKRACMLPSDRLRLAHRRSKRPRRA